MPRYSVKAEVEITAATRDQAREFAAQAIPRMARGAGGWLLPSSDAVLACLACGQPVNDSSDPEGWVTVEEVRA